MTPTTAKKVMGILNDLKISQNARDFIESNESDLGKAEKVSLVSEITKGVSATMAYADCPLTGMAKKAFETMCRRNGIGLKTLMEDETYSAAGDIGVLKMSRIEILASQYQSGKSIS